MSATYNILVNPDVETRLDDPICNDDDGFERRVHIVIEHLLSPSIVCITSTLIALIANVACLCDSIQTKDAYAVVREVKDFWVVLSWVSRVFAKNGGPAVTVETECWGEISAELVQ